MAIFSDINTREMVIVANGEEMVVAHEDETYVIEAVKTNRVVRWN